MKKKLQNLNYQHIGTSEIFLLWWSISYIALSAKGATRGD